jgi:hypothetical protein
MQEPVILATSRSRISVILKLGGLIAVGMALQVSILLYALHVAPMPVCDQLPYIRVTAFAGTAFLVALAVILFRRGFKVWRSGQFPPPGTSVFFTRQIYTGWWANLNAFVLCVSSGLVVVTLFFWVRFFLLSEFGFYVSGLRRCVA